MNEKGITELLESNSDINKYTWYMLGKMDGIDALYEDVIRYREDILSAEIYNLLQDKWNAELGKQYNRNSAKKKFLEILNSPRVFECEEKDMLYDKHYELYPNVMTAIDGVNGFFKTRRMKSRLPGDKRAPFATITQTIESWFLLDVVCQIITSENPTIPLYTIHDAIYSTSDYIDFIADVITHESTRIFGAPCKVESHYEVY